GRLATVDFGDLVLVEVKWLRFTPRGAFTPALALQIDFDTLWGLLPQPRCQIESVDRRRRDTEIGIQRLRVLRDARDGLRGRAGLLLHVEHLVGAGQHLLGGVGVLILRDSYRVADVDFFTAEFDLRRAGALDD